MTASLLESKTMKLVLITALLVVGLIVFAALMQAIFNIEIPYVSDGLLALTGNSAVGSARNAYVDAPIRLQQAQSPAPPPPATGGAPMGPMTPPPGGAS